MVDDDIERRGPEAEAANAYRRGAAAHGVEANLAALIGHTADGRALDRELGTGDGSAE